MRTLLGIVFMAVAVAWVLLTPRMSRSGLSLHFSTEDLRATHGPRYRRVRLMILMNNVVGVALGCFWIYCAWGLLS